MQRGKKGCLCMWSSPGLITMKCVCSNFILPAQIKRLQNGWILINSVANSDIWSKNTGRPYQTWTQQKNRKGNKQVQQEPLSCSGYTCSYVRHCSVRISSSGAALLSLLLNISRTMDRRFQIPSGSRPLKGRSRQAHSAAAGGSVDDRYMEFTSLWTETSK